MDTIGWVISTAPEIFLLISMALGTFIGRLQFKGFSPVLGVAVPYAVGNVLLTILGPVIMTLTNSG
jgi:hypothetical protein